MARVLEHGARAAQLGKHELGRRSAAGLRNVDQPAVALDDSQELERGHPAARDRARHAEHRAAERWAPSLLDGRRPVRASRSDPRAGQPRHVAHHGLCRRWQCDVLRMAMRGLLIGEFETALTNLLSSR